MTFQQELVKSLQVNGDAIAIEKDGTQMSYAALLKAANAITAFLLKQVKSATAIGLLLPDREALITSMIGVLNARCVFVPLDENLPAKRLSAIVREIDLQYIISSRQFELPSGLNNNHGVNIWYVEDLLQAGDAEHNALEYPACNETDSIYIYFTSGTTGTPKGIIGKNSSLLQFVQWEIGELNLVPGVRISQLINPSFDAFLRDVFVPLMCGGIICIPPDGKEFFSTEKMIPWLDEQKINLVHCVPSVFRIINNGSLTAGKFKNLEYILLSGEKIIPSELNNWFTVFGNRVQLLNLYGASETTMIRAFYRIRAEDARLTKIPIGQPIRDTELVIVGENGKPCGPLITGDLYIVSDFTGKGYLNAPELTHQKFIQWHSGITGETIAFKTGDKARQRADGNVELMGREDRQIKLRGIRIEPDEIEYVLGQMEGVRSPVVIYHTNEQQEGSLIAFVIMQEQESDARSLEDAALQYLQENLPDYMVPAKLVAVQEYPLLSNGKINYNELINQLQEKTVILPVTATEQKVWTIWKEVLGDKSISTEDSFHSIGGNSISMMRLIGKIYKEMNVRITLDELFNNLTIQKQAQLIDKAMQHHVLNILKAATKPAYNLSLAQERLYYYYTLNNGSTAFNLPMTWKITGEVDKQKIESTLRLLIERHESLRTEFRFINGVLKQVIKERVDFSLHEIVTTNDDLQHTITAFIQPFDLAVAPLMRGALVSTDDAVILIIDTHHIACDGMSQALLVADFIRLYKGEKLAALPVQYKDYAEWEQVFRTSTEYVNQREIWLKSFEGELPALKLPTTSQEIKRTDKGGNVFFSVNTTDLGNLFQSLQQEEVTVFSGLFAAYAVFLAQLTGQDDLVIGINTSGRMQQELEGIVGMFVKTLPIRSRLNLHLPFIQTAKALHQHLIKANSRQLYDLAHIVSDLNRSRSNPVENLFDAMFVLLDFDNQQLLQGNEGFTDYRFENHTAKYPLTLFAAEGGDGYHFRMEYSLDYFTRQDIDILIDRFKSLIKKISLDPEASCIHHVTDSTLQSLVVQDDISFNF